ncbi:hypothetical protein TR74_06090, partial [Carbonactinospora thermoautotrophica]
ETPTLLRYLVKQRHWQRPDTFIRQYENAAHALAELENDRKLRTATISERQVERWQAGRIKTRPHPDQCRVLEFMFGYSVDRLFAPVPPSGQIGPPDRPMWRKEAGSDQTPPAGLSPTPWPSTARTAHREAEPECGAQAMAWDGEIAMAAEESARFARRAGANNVGEGVLDQLDVDVRRLAVQYLTRPPYVLFGELARLQGEVFRLLDGRQRPEQTTRLYLVAGQVCVLLAHASADLGHPYAAEAHARTAWLCADYAQHNPLRAYVRWVQSNVAYWNGRYREAAEIAHSGQAYATSGTARLRLASQEARAHAALGDTRAVHQALGVASEAPDPVTDDEPGVFRFGPGKAAYYASEAHCALGDRSNLQRAVSQAEQALDLFTRGPDVDRCPEFVAAARLDLISAYLALGDLEATDEYLRPVLATPPEHRTAPVVQRVAAISQALAQPEHAGRPLAGDLREQISLFCAYPASRELPSAAT